MTDPIATYRQIDRLRGDPIISVLVDECIRLVEEAQAKQRIAERNLEQMACFLIFGGEIYE
jgi:hypothetical protein